MKKRGRRTPSERRPYDNQRVRLFQSLAAELQHESWTVPPVDSQADSELQAFIESYFTNYIEGTEFDLEEAYQIVTNARPLEHRLDDSQDLLGTYDAILASKATPVIPQTFEAFATQLQAWNQRVIASRLAKHPGEFKTQNNRAGSTLFVVPELVIGTLEKGYEIIMGAAEPEARGALAMFVVAEVHPFADGNGRTARLALNQFLTAAGLTRIVIPLVYRDDYIRALKIMSSIGDPAPLIRMLARAGRFSRWLNISSKDTTVSALKASNALQQPAIAELTFDYPPAVR